MKYLFGADGELLNPNKKEYPAGSVIATKGAVMCWEEHPTAGKRGTELINGVGEILQGPDRLDRYLVHVAGHSAWVHIDSIIVRGR